MFTTGFALFSMFFGSGNLVFPVLVGKESGGHFLLGFFGLFLTGVLVPFLGALAMWLYKGDNKAFFSVLGKPATFWFPLLALSLMGPFGVLARCITVAHGSFRQLVPDTSLITFSIVLCILIFLCTYKKNQILPLLGSFLTPVLLLSLAAIAFFGLSSGSLQPVTANGLTSFARGFSEGYQTMDLLAAFFFSSFVIQSLQNTFKKELNETTAIRVFLPSALLGMGILSAVYIILVTLGSIYAPELDGVPPEEMLGTIAASSLGPYARIIVCVAVASACFTTAIVLATLFADFLKKEVFQDKIPDAAAMGTTLVISFLVSTLEFSGIARFIGPIMSAIYPGLIVFSLVMIGLKLFQAGKTAAVTK